MQNTIETTQLNQDLVGTFEPMETKYGKDFKIPELPAMLRDQLMSNEKAANILAQKSVVSP